FSLKDPGGDVMSASQLGTRVREILDGLNRGDRHRTWRPDTRQQFRLESLEERGLLTISATGFFSSTAAAGGNFHYTIALANASTSTSSIGTFWFAWTTNQDYMASQPITVSPPTGWIDRIVHSGSGDGYSIEFISADPNDNIAPGSTLNFGFESSDTPAEI